MYFKLSVSNVYLYCLLTIFSKVLKERFSFKSSNSKKFISRNNNYYNNMPRDKRNRNLFASAIAGSITSRRSRSIVGTDPTTPVVVDEERETESGSSN